MEKAMQPCNKSPKTTSQSGSVTSSTSTLSNNHGKKSVRKKKDTSNVPIPQSQSNPLSNITNSIFENQRLSRINRRQVILKKRHANIQASGSSTIYDPSGLQSTLSLEGVERNYTPANDHGVPECSTVQSQLDIGPVIQPNGNVVDFGWYYDDGDPIYHCTHCSARGKINHDINKGKGPQVFQLHGENYHLTGSLMPNANEKPKFLQLYIHDTINEIRNRELSLSKNGKIDNKLRPELIEALMKMLNHCNPLVKAFRSYKDRYQNSDIEDTVRMVLIAKRDKDARTHNLPTATEVAALIPGDFEEGLDNRDIMLEAKDGSLRRINELYVGYLALQYPLLFPYAEDGYQVGIEDGFSHKEDRKRKTISMREYCSYRIQDRLMESQAIIRSKRLYQKFLVNVFTMIEANRLRYFRNNQVKLRSEKFVNLVEAHNEGQSDLSNTGKRILIPASFTGGSRYMNNNYLDAMAICKYFGFPDLFITFTCNPNWPEIVRYCQKRNLKPEDRPDMCYRIFKMKLESLMTDLTEKKLFGETVCGIYTIEFQKRGLPHAHILIWMASKYKFPTPESIDKVISAEIPNKETDPELYEVVKQNMIHGPCGNINKSSPCMVNGRCSKMFPKKYCDRTVVDNIGFPHYMRRQTDDFVEKNGIRLDNSWVVPYNRKLSLRYRAYINVEWCTQARSIKYLFKYIHKGPDRVLATIENNAKDIGEFANEDGDDASEVTKDEIREYFECRYVSACEASWRILAFAIHYRSLPVEKLYFHLPGEQPCVYGDDDPVETVLNRRSVQSSMLLAFFEACDKYPELSKNLTYAEFPIVFIYDRKEGPMSNQF
ncbi:uncharacterized protein LOC112083973 [Eutrema salsugineum]|uniref:uncharacterized protein LOC112083973 n=1 Tax=Eutrema salsugineum TaxID=72664 RepID=UPI000CED251A|nr:uncharacterized protein LOC112083973 [Eutrema salsugineum]